MTRRFGSYASRLLLIAALVPYLTLGVSADKAFAGSPLQHRGVGAISLAVALVATVVGVLAWRKATDKRQGDLEHHGEQPGIEDYFFWSHLAAVCQKPHSGACCIRKGPGEPGIGIPIGRHC